MNRNTFTKREIQLLKNNRMNLVRRKIQMQRNLLKIKVIKKQRKRISHAWYRKGQLNFHVSLTWGTVYNMRIDYDNN